MALAFKSSSPERFVISGDDGRGRIRTVTAERFSGDFNWRLHLTHPSGRHWEATYHGPGILDAMGELLSSKDAEYVADCARNDRPHTERFDGNRAVNHFDQAGAPITGIPQRRQ